MKYLTQGRTTLVYELPLAELVNDFFDHLKSRSKGYASMEYNFIGYRQNDLVRLDVAINQEQVDALSCIVHKDKAYSVGRGLVTKLKEIVPRAQFKIPIQARIGAKIIASEQISALKKGMFILFYSVLYQIRYIQGVLTHCRLFFVLCVENICLNRCYREVRIFPFNLNHCSFSSLTDHCKDD